MREIKFRGKRINNGEMIYGDLIYIEGKSHIYQHKDPVYGGSGSWLVVPDTVGQFTGLHDKNGVEIYEGDMFKTSDSNGECRVVLKWDGNNARFLGYDQNAHIWYVGREPAIEVIGNIHDNLDLIRK